MRNIVNVIFHITIKFQYLRKKYINIYNNFMIYNFILSFYYSNFIILSYFLIK